VPPSLLSSGARRRVFATILLIGSGLAGCASSSPIPSPYPPTPTVSASLTDKRIPVVRYGRYTLVELAPEPAQRDLLQQTVEVSIPPTLDANVGDAMRHVLLRSGYRLCDAIDADALYALPLPAAHLRLGPLLLRDALLTLAGPAWTLSVDDLSREVCFTRVADPVAAAVDAVVEATR